MEYYVLDDYKEQQPKKLNHKKLIKVIAIVTSITALIVLFALYIGNEGVRSWTDKYLLGKDITENTGAIIEVDTDASTHIYAYDRYITILERNKLKNYNGSGEKESEIDVNITNPLFASSGRYLCLAEKNGHKIYLISGANIIWQKDLDSEISQIFINSNGYISVSHKTSVKLFNKDGKELTTVHMAETFAVCTAISSNNSELAIAEINYSRKYSTIKHKDYFSRKGPNRSTKCGNLHI